MMPDRCRDTLALLTEPLAQAADTLKLILIDHYPHLFSPAALRPLATGIHRILQEQTGACEFLSIVITDSV